MKKFAIFDRMGKKTIIGSWILFFVFLFVVYVTSLASLSKYTRNVISNNINKTMEFSLSQISDNIDGFVYKANHFRSYVMTREETREMLTKNYNSNVGKYEYYQYMDIVRQAGIEDYENFNVFLWFEYEGVIVTPSSVMTAEEYYSSFFFEYFNSFEDFRDVILNSSYQFYGTVPTNTNSIFMYLSQISYPTANDKRIKCVAFCNADDLLYGDEGLYFMDKYAFIIKNDDNVAYCKTNIDTFEPKNMSEKLNSEAVRVDGKDYICTNFESFKNDISLHYLVPRNVFMKEIQKFNNMTLIILLFLFAINLFAIYRFTKKNYKPIYNLLNLFEIQHSKNNEFNEITNKVLEYKDSQARIIDLLNMQKKFAQHYVLLNLIQNNSLLSQDDYHIIFGDREPFEYNYIAVLKMKGTAQEDIYQNFRQLTEDIFQQEGLIVPRIYFNERLIMLINTPAENIEKIDSLIGTLNDFSIINYNAKIYVGVSRVFVDFFEISERYDEAKKALKYAVDSNQIITHFDKMPKVTNTNYYYPPDIEKQILENMKSGNFDKVDKILNMVYNANFNERHIEKIMEDYLFYNIIGTFNKFIDCAPVSSSLKQVNVANLPLMLSNCTNTEERKKTISSIISLFSNALNEENLNKDSSLIKAVKKYISLNYSNPDLNVSTTALYFEVRQDYLSRLFKQKEGIGLLEFINSIRMKSAATLLDTTDESAVDISKKVGFDNYRTFSRRFVKHFGMSPQSYREKTK